MWFWGIISGLWFGRTQKTVKNPKRPFQVGNIVSVIVGVVAIGLSCFFAYQAEKSTKRVESLVEAGLYPANEEFAKDMDLDISKIEDPLIFARICIANKKGDRKGLKSRLEEYLEIAPESGYPYWLIGKYYSDGDTTINDNPDSAISYYSKAIDFMDYNHPAKPSAFNNRGIEKGKSDKYTPLDQIVDYNEAMKLKPKYAMAFANRGVAKGNSEKYTTEDQIADYDTAIVFFGKDNPEAAYALYDRGVAKAKLGRYEDAIADYDRAIELKPDYAKAFNNRGSSKDKLMRYEEAIADFDRAIELKPDFAEAFYNRGVVKGKLKRYEEAIADYDDAIRLNPNFAEAFNNRGVAKDELEQYEEAIADYDRAIELKPGYTEAFVNRGAAKYNLERYEDAIADYDRAIELKPDFVEAIHNLKLAKRKLEEQIETNPSGGGDSSEE